MKLYCFQKTLALALAMSWALFSPASGIALANKFNPTNGLVIRAWNTETGLPQNTVNAITQTQDGYLWLATQEGLARFDGVRFTVYGLQDGLPSIDVRTVYEDSEGTLWIGTSSGLSRLVNGRIETVPLPTRLAASDVVVTLMEDSENRLWVGTRSGVGLFQGGKFTENPAMSDLGNVVVLAFAQDQDGVVWISTAHGLFTFSKNHLSETLGPPGFERMIAHCLLVDKLDNLWVSIGNGIVLCRNHEGKWTAYSEADGLPFVYVSCMAQEADGTIWAGTLDDGLYHFESGHFIAIRKEDGLSANDIRSLCPDREGNLWIGTRIGGLNRLSHSKLMVYGVAQGLANDFTRSAAEATDGTLWVGTIGGGLYHGESGRFTRVPMEIPSSTNVLGGFYFAFVHSVLAITNNIVWYGADRGLLRIKDGQLSDIYTNEPWVRLTSISALCDDLEGKIWIGTADGKLIHFQNEKFVEFPHSVARGAINALARQPDGSLWIGSAAGGLKCIQPQSNLILSPTNGLLSLSIRTLYFDSDGTLWIGTSGGGLSRYRNGHIVTFTTQQGLWADTISQIIEDNNGNLWCGCNHGIFRISKKELNDLAIGKIAFVHPRVFGLSDGMPVEECSSGFCPAGLKMKSGLLCFSTVKGLVLIDPQVHKKALPNEAKLEEILVSGQLYQPSNVISSTIANGELSRHIIVPHGAWEVEIHYTAISLSSPELVRFRYRMEGMDKDWLEAGDRRTAYYHRIPPGDYTFQVTACNADGIWSQQRAELGITVQPYFWETSWFKATIGLFVLALIAGVIRLMERRRYSHLQTQHAIEKERLRISKDIHDDIGGILTQVSQISDLGQSGTESQPILKSQFQRIGHQSRAAVQALDEIVWATNPKNDNLSRFAEYVCRFADEFFEVSDIRCWQEVPTDLPSLPLRSNVRHNVFLAIKEAFTNILKHSNATEVWLRLTLENSHVCVEIEDNGHGFVPSQIAEGGNGLDNMKTRLEECGGKTELISFPKRGTKIRFYFPLTKPN